MLKTDDILAKVRNITKREDYVVSGNHVYYTYENTDQQEADFERLLLAGLSVGTVPGDETTYGTLGIRIYS